MLDRLFSPTIVLSGQIYKTFTPEEMARLIMHFDHVDNARLSYCLGGPISYKEYLIYYFEVRKYLKNHNWLEGHLFDGPEESESVCDVEPYGSWTTISSNDVEPRLGNKIFATYESCLAYSRRLLKPAKDCYTCIHFLSCSKKTFDNCKEGVNELM